MSSPGDAPMLSHQYLSYSSLASKPHSLCLHDTTSQPSKYISVWVQHCHLWDEGVRSNLSGSEATGSENKVGESKVSLIRACQVLCPLHQAILPLFRLFHSSQQLHLSPAIHLLSSPPHLWP